MEFRTTFRIEPSPWKITYNDPVMFIGSCFASEIGSQLETGRMPVMINPAGPMYNPVSVLSNLELIISNRKLGHDDLYSNDGIYLSFLHNTGFSSPDREKVLERINRKTEAAHKFLASARFLFVTFGTARVYRFKDTGMIVSNCHKLPSGYFTRELLSVEEIVRLWSDLVDRLHDLYPGLKIYFTVSPVRHWKDGAHANQVSKAVLLLAIERLLARQGATGYFPAYELLLDDLRDYRFYDKDMLHPSPVAVEYIWKAFEGSFLDGETLDLRNEISKIVRAAGHRLLADSPAGIAQFASGMLESITKLAKRYPAVNLSAEKDHFTGMLKTAGQSI